MTALKLCPQCGTEYELDRKFCPNDGSALKLQGGGDDLVGQIIAERYHVLKKLGEGGMGQVYLAEHVKMGRKSAVKVMHPGIVHDADSITRFNREAANASRINHPNVAAIYDFGETSDGLIYLAMEFIEGGSLTSLIERQGALPAPRAANIARQTGEGLSVAHELGIVHRDLKPDNIMIARNRDGSDAVKVVDFGIAKATQSEAQNVTKTGLVVGTPEYMSPEQLAGDKMDGRSDIYSLGLVTFAMLTGKLPFPSETVQESMIMRLTDRPRTLGQMKPDVPWPAELQAVLDRVLARDMNERYQSANEFGRDLERAVAGMPMTSAAEAGTMVVGAASVPATRVSTAGGGATMKAGAVRAPSAAGAAPVAVAARGGRGLMVGIAVGVVALGGAGAYFMMKGKPTDGGGAPAVTSASLPPSVGGTTGQTTSDNAALAPQPAAQSDASAPKGGQVGVPEKGSPPAGGSRGGAASPSAATTSANDAHEMWATLNGLYPKLADMDTNQVADFARSANELVGKQGQMSPTEYLDARLFRGFAYGLQHRLAASCLDLNFLAAQSQYARLQTAQAVRDEFCGNE